MLGLKRNCKVGIFVACEDGWNLENLFACLCLFVLAWRKRVREKDSDSLHLVCREKEEQERNGWRLMA
jgi:hypothetical protein